MIKAKFAYMCDIEFEEPVEFKSYKEFFEWFTRHQDKGAIYNIEDDGNTK